jgi:NAD(P)-dependent dehydrogenase (short-subunit alcohol dehydrogenase family)
MVDMVDGADPAGGKLKGKIAVVTGGATGIGAATAELFAAEGATSVILDYNETEGAGVAERISAAGHSGAFIQVDVRHEVSVAAAFAQVSKLYGHVDILVAAAGVLKGAYRSIAEFEEADWDATLDTNLKGTFLTAKHGTPLMVAARESVLMLIASGAGVAGGSSSHAYAASKAGIHGMQHKLRAEYEGQGMRVYAICPGGIATPLKLENIGQKAVLDGADPQAAMEAAKQTLGDPIGVARVLAFLASDEGSYVRGTIFTR